MVQSIRHPAMPHLADSPGQSDPAHPAPPRPQAPPPGNSARARDAMRNQGKRTSKNLHLAFHSGASRAPAAAQPAYPKDIARKMGELDALKKERAGLAGGHDDLHSPSAQLRAKELDGRIAELADTIQADMKTIADNNERANQIAVSSV